MTAANYQRCLANSLSFEGGYANNPKDPGGATMRGVTQATYDAYRKSKGLSKQSVKNLAEGELQEIYRTGYWNKVLGDRLPKGVDQVMFDTAVNSGPGRALSLASKVLGVPATASDIVAAATVSKDKVELVQKLCAARMAFLHSLPTFGTFGKGWTTRVNKVEALGVKMAKEDLSGPVSSPAVPTGVAAGGAVAGASAAAVAGWDWGLIIFVAVCCAIAGFVITKVMRDR